jgi:hypothetical protein
VDLPLVDEHLDRAAKAPGAYAQFEAAWKALNLLYASEYREGAKNTEQALLNRLVLRLRDGVARIVNEVGLRPLASINPPIIDAKKWDQGNVRDEMRHNIVRKIVTELRRRDATVEDLQAVVELLYVIRCNHFHGAKSPERARDQEVLGAASPILLRLVHCARDYYAKLARDSA